MNNKLNIFLISNVLTFNLILGLSPLFSTATAKAAPQCVQLFKTPTSTLLREIENKPVPRGDVRLANKTIPIILVNHNSVSSLLPVYSKSIGFVVTHQRGAGNDHGLFRLGEYFIDRDAPGMRARGEVNQTGISWASVKDYVDHTYKKGGGQNRIEVLFELTESEFNTATIYQKMRRAALIRPDFSFGRDTNPQDTNNRLAQNAENCFSFCTGAGAQSQNQTIRQKINQLSGVDSTTLLNNAEMKTYIDGIKKYLLESDLSDAFLNPTLTTHLDTPQNIKNLNLDRNAEIELLNWIVGFKISEDYTSLLRNLNIHNSSDFSNVDSPRATAVLVYDATVGADYFLTSQYESQGVFSTWKNTDLTVPAKEAPKKPFAAFRKIFGF